eukprot:361050-Hanusia_phi.AAC.1
MFLVTPRVCVDRRSLACTRSSAHGYRLVDAVDSLRRRLAGVSRANLIVHVCVRGRHRAGGGRRLDAGIPHVEECLWPTRNGQKILRLLLYLLSLDILMEANGNLRTFRLPDKEGVSMHLLKTTAIECACSTFGRLL